LLHNYDIQMVMKRILPSTSECFAAIRAPELYRNFLIHLFVMFPAAMVMCWLAQQIDIRYQIAAFGDYSWRVPMGAIAIIVGGIWVWYVYGYLFLAGGGSPGTHVDGGPVRVVDTGPYSAIRHPSVLGKLLGVTGLGCIWGSPTFLMVFLPILLLYSLISNRLIQERFCHLRFGEMYTVYCQNVPMLLPTQTSIRRWKDGVPAINVEELDSVVVQPPGVWLEFRWYLIGLISLILLFLSILKLS
jgi:protein-S-isoprenylcysteine O-methyltransferase Ste14